MRRISSHEKELHRIFLDTDETEAVSDQSKAMSLLFLLKYELDSFIFTDLTISTEEQKRRDELEIYLAAEEKAQENVTVAYLFWYIVMLTLYVTTYNDFFLPYDQ